MRTEVSVIRMYTSSGLCLCTYVQVLRPNGKAGMVLCPFGGECDFYLSDAKQADADGC